MKAMKTEMDQRMLWKAGARRFVFALVLAAVCLLWPAAARADKDPSNDAAQLVVSVTPRVDRGIEIDTENVNLDMGLVNLGASTQTVRPATVTIQGNITNIELVLSAQITGGWVFDDNVTASTETDKLGVWAVLKDTTSSAVPSKSGSDFDDAQDAMESATSVFGATRAGLPGGDTGTNDRFEDGTVNMDSLIPGTKRHLWFYFNTPPYTSTAAEQQIQFTISVTPGP